MTPPTTDIDISELETIALALADKGSKWHFHIAAGGCQIAEGREGITFVLEAPESGETYRAPASDDDRVIGERLARLLHGSEVMDDQPSSSSLGELSPATSALIDKAHFLSEQKQPWHHHELFPECTFNPNPGRWTLQLEYSGTAQSAVSDIEPRAALSVIEKLFYAQQEVG